MPDVSWVYLGGWPYGHYAHARPLSVAAMKLWQHPPPLWLMGVKAPSEPPDYAALGCIACASAGSTGIPGLIVLVKVTLFT